MKNNKKMIFIVGGIKSGKSQFVYTLCKNYKKVYFIATAEAKDNGMKKRINKHKNERPKSFITIEEPRNLIDVIKKLPSNFPVVIDCINLWLNNVLNFHSEDTILKYIDILCRELNNKSLSIIVSNEVGCTLVSSYPSGRKFQELLGKINQIIAKNANEVYYMFSGIPVKIKKS